MSPVKRVLSLPGRFARGSWRFFNPKLKAGRVPYARTVLALQLLAAVLFVGYTLAKKGIILPFAPEPYYVEVVLGDAAGLDSSKEPGASVAGATAGKVTGVRYEDGQAIATLRLDPDLEGKVFADATASLRPINVLQVLNVNIHPGDPATGPLPEGQVITSDRTDAFVAIDELTSMLDADTQAQVQVLISEAAAALKGREPELRRILAELGELTDTATPLAQALDERRELLAKLTDHLNIVFDTLGDRGTQLAQTIDAGSRTLEITAGREGELAEATRLLAPTVAEAQRSLAAARALAEPLNFSLDQLLPVAGNLEPTANRALELIPQAEDLLATGSDLVADGAKPVALFKEGTRGLEGRVEHDLIPSIDRFGETIAALDKYKGGIAQTADLWSGAFSGTANNGVYSQIFFGGAEVTPKGLGLSAPAARSRAGRSSKLALMLAEALERTCEDNSFACELRFGLGGDLGLPVEPVTVDAEGDE